MRIVNVGQLVYCLLVAMTMGYSMPLKAVKFYSYTNDEGVTVYSNVPRDCVSGSVMTCMDYHPAIRGAESGPQVAADAVGRNSTPANPVNRSASRSLPEFQQQAVEHGLFNVLENIGEMNALVDQYFPGNSDPVEAAKVRQRQEKILDMLEIIRRGAGDDEKSSIDRAIGILRDNLVD